MGTAAHNRFIIKKMATEWVTYCMATAASALNWGVQKIDFPSREMSPEPLMVFIQEGEKTRERFLLVESNSLFLQENLHL